MSHIRIRLLLLIAVALTLALPGTASAKRLVGITDGPSVTSEIVTFSDSTPGTLLSSATIQTDYFRKPLAIARRADGKYWLIAHNLLSARTDLLIVGLDGSISFAPPLYPNTNLPDETSIAFEPALNSPLHAVTSARANYTVSIGDGNILPGNPINSTGSPRPAALAVSNSGTAYSYDHDHDDLITINLATGAWSILADSPFVAKQIQQTGMAIAPDNTAWLDAVKTTTTGNNPHLFRLNLTTGALTELGQFSVPIKEVAYLSEEPAGGAAVKVSGVVAAGSIGTDGKGNATATLSCPAGAATCSASYSLETTKAVAAAKKKKKKLKLGSGKTAIPAGTSKKVTITLSSKGKKLLKKKKKLAVTLTVTSDAVIKKTGTLKAPKKKKKK